ncbi:MAG: 30S ribosomal protein S17 [Pseudomonadota bacterium]
MTQQLSQATESAPKADRVKVGKVISNKMDKTVTVFIERQVKHPLYGKYIKRSTKLKAHDEENRCQMGDTVAIKECRPISKHKSWTVTEVLLKGSEI